jgi:hypothetical protein
MSVYDWRSSCADPSLNLKGSSSRPGWRSFSSTAQIRLSDRRQSDSPVASRASVAAEVKPLHASFHFTSLQSDGSRWDLGWSVIGWEKNAGPGSGIGPALTGGSSGSEEVILLYRCLDPECETLIQPDPPSRAFW